MSTGTNARPKWHLIFYVLAAFGLITVSGSLYLNHLMMENHARSVASELEWGGWLARLDELRNLAISVNAPGNDVFDSKDVDAEEAKQLAALKAFDRRLAATRHEIESNVPLAQAVPLLEGLDAVRSAMNNMVTEARLIFSHLREGDAERAGRRMATMDRKNAGVSIELGAVASRVREIQREHFAEHIAATSFLRKFEFVIGGLIILMVCFVTLYGHKIAQEMKRADEENERNLADLEQSRAESASRASEVEGAWERQEEHGKEMAALAEALHESETRLAGILDIATEAVVSVDETFRIRLFNKGAQTTFGYELEEAIGQPLQMLIPQRFHDSHREHAEGFVRSAETNSEITQRNEVLGLRKDGTEFAIEASVSRLDQLGDKTYTAMVRDITDRKQAEEDLLAAKEQAEEANRSKSDFLASMSHEIRTPMNGVLGMVGVLLDSELSSEQRKHARTIRDSGEALLSLLNDILDLSKIEAGQVELEVLDFDLEGLLDSVDSLWGPRLQGKGLELSIQVAPDVAPVLSSDPTRIRQILFNLVGNAAKFTDQGKIAVDVSQRALKDGELELRFAVTDTGIGIEPDAQSRLFSKFTQADKSVTRRFGGTGLGLAICKQLAELLDGEIGVESAPGQGSSFWFTVRCVPGDAAIVDTEAWTGETIADEAPESSRPLRILVAEDNHINQTVLLAMLGKAGHRIDIAGNGLEAISSVTRVAYDLLLMDVQMPEMDGMTATRRIRDLPGETGRIPIIALTANAMKGDREKYLAAGMNDYVSKPIKPNALFAAIAGCTGVKPSDAARDTEAATTVAPQGNPSADDADALSGLIDDLDDLIKEA